MIWHISSEDEHWIHAEPTFILQNKSTRPSRIHIDIRFLSWVAFRATSRKYVKRHPRLCFGIQLTIAIYPLCWACSCVYVPWFNESCYHTQAHQRDCENVSIRSNMLFFQFDNDCVCESLHTFTHSTAIRLTYQRFQYGDQLFCTFSLPQSVQSIVWTRLNTLVRKQLNVNKMYRKRTRIIMSTVFVAFSWK